MKKNISRKRIAVIIMFIVIIIEFISAAIFHSNAVKQSNLIINTLLYFSDNK
nr:MAG TPA: hypothetical protein [Caudoviricetes sp.]